MRPPSPEGALRVAPFAGGWAVFSDKGHPLSDTFAVRGDAIEHAQKLAAGVAFVVVEGDEPFEGDEGRPATR